MRRSSRITLLLALTLAAGAAGPGALALARPQPPQPAAIPDDALGRCAAAFLAMANQPTKESVAAFEDAYASKERRLRSSNSERLQRMQDMHQEMGGVSSVRVLGRTPASLALLVKSGNGEELAFDFEFDPGDAGKLTGVRIMPAAEYSPPRALTPKERRALVEDACIALEEGYVYPEVAREMSADVLARLADGKYDDIKDDAALAQRLTQDFRAISKDRHLGVMPVPTQAPGQRHSMMGTADQARENYAFREVKLLPGNIGYLKFDAFVESEDAYKTASAALGFLAHCDALIFDLRTNGGGSPEMIRYITTYLVDTRTHLNDMVDREGNVVEEFWTLNEVPGTRFSPRLPVYVLTSGRTFSGAEEFSYNLKNLKRATIVGETTGGGAHPVRPQRVGDRLMLRVPYMRARNPISGANWEGVGVEPDVKVAADEALDKATALAKGAIAAAGAGR